MISVRCLGCGWHGKRRDFSRGCPECRRVPLVPRQSEAEFQSQVTDLATLWGWFWDHDTDPRRKKAGWPDLPMIHEARGLMIWVELKVPPYECTAAQLAMHGRLRAAGQTVYVWKPQHWPEIERALIGR